MRILAPLTGLALAAVVLTGCAPLATPATVSGGDDVAGMLMTDAEAGDWEITPDSGSVDGDSDSDCTGAPYDWPDIETLAGASQFLDRHPNSLALIIKKVDGDDAPTIEAVRGALAPCAPASGAAEHGAMVTPVGDDSFAYQSPGSDSRGDYLFTNMVIACGPMHLEVLGYLYDEVPQQELEELFAPAIERVLDAGGC